ncbi:putative GPI-anchored protein At4g28100 [Bidens hawaiensis]|uniref:putative GPI-anchored protein At4g28100 n=1 Tax=Bidens hawaiensis TaxID=980011 RepID=UPI0040495D19
MIKFSFHSLFNIIIIIVMCSLFEHSWAGLLAEPAQPLKPPDDSAPNTVPSFPVQTESELCRLDLSAELFGGVNAACGRNLDRSRCCPVLAAWLFAAHARSALQVNASAPASSDEMPMMPDDSQNCVNSLQSSLQSRNIHIPQPNASCDAVLCFCGIRLHQIGSLSCPAAFNVTKTSPNATPTAAVRNLEKNCRNSSYSGCTKCLGALQKLNDDGQNGTRKSHHEDDRASKIMTRDCQLMGLTWLLARNKTAYIPTVSAVLRAIMYSAHPPHESKCSPDQENMPLAVDSLQFDKSSSSLSRAGFIVMTLLPLIAEFVLW